MIKTAKVGSVSGIRPGRPAHKDPCYCSALSCRQNWRGKVREGEEVWQT